jgi:hypothetical protein
MSELPPPQLPRPPHRPREKALAMLITASDEAERRGAQRSFAIGGILDGGAARAKHFDRIALDRYLKDFSQRPSSLEADWIATTAGLFYVSPDAFRVWSRPWDRIKVHPGRTPWAFARFARVRLTMLDSGETITLRLAKAGAKNLLAIAAHYGAIAE